mmetsp:Transcript_11177/g.28281  ORF Transcript_11177/g.28281 Transcript_11177/m.28281 type:complete len:207 (-) Transcript_11177:1741-2361(-)
MVLVMVLAAPGGETCLAALVKAFSECKDALDAGGDVPLREYAAACGRIVPVFQKLGVVFGFASGDLANKVELLKGVCKESGTTAISVSQVILEDVRNGVAEQGGSNARNLHRVTHAVKFIYLLIQNLLNNREESLRESAHKAYLGSVEYYLDRKSKFAVQAGLWLLPDRDGFLRKIGETGAVKTSIAPSKASFCILKSLCSEYVLV